MRVTFEAVSQEDQPPQCGWASSYLLEASGVEKAE